MDITIESGSSVSHYRIISAIGAGGMGQVYKAQDLTLERTVALKVLPPELVRNDERVRRFMQEARSASSLNHPNIVTIHEIGQSPLSSGADGTPPPDAPPIHFIAMELIDGATLKRKIHDGVTDLHTLLGYLAQAAEGLSKAHAAGIVHRDLKPENIMVTRDGFTKVLDFGLAKLSVKKSASDGSSATDLRDGTREGTVMGTVGYMSPEQVRGEIVDQRSDIFSFGCILYEAATRRRPFEADSDIDVMHKIMHEKPVPVDELNPKVPAELRRMIRRCLAKDPERRYQSMKDLALELADVVDEFDELSASAASRSSGSLSQPLITPSRRRNPWIVVAVALALAAVGAVALLKWGPKRGETKRQSVAYGSMKMEQLTSTNDVVQAAISPDAKYVALVTSDHQGNFSLSVLQVATKATVPVVTGGKMPFTGISFSPDSNYLLYGRAEQESGSGYSSLFQVPSLGGNPRKLVFDVDTSVSFSPDGKQLAFGRGHPDTGENWLLVVNSDGTGERKLAAYQRIDAPVPPAWSPDGKTIVIPIMKVTGGVRHELTAVDVATGTKKVIGAQKWADIRGVSWLADGKELVLAGKSEPTARSQVWMQPYPDGEPARITNDLNSYGRVSVTGDGSTIAVIRSERNGDLVTVNTADSTATPLLPHSSDLYQDLSVAKSGTVAATVLHETGSDLGVINPGSAQATLLTHDGRSLGPSISADGKTIVFFSIRVGGVPHLFVTDSDGGNARQLTKGDGEVYPTISPDGKTVTYFSVGGDVLRIDTAGGAPVRLARTTNSGGGIFPISPDGKTFCYPVWHNTGGRSQVALTVADLITGKTLREMPWDSQEMKWSPSGDSFVAVRRAGGVANLYSIPLQGGEPRPLTRFTDGDIAGFDTAGDGKLVIARETTRSDVVTIRDFR